MVEYFEYIMDVMQELESKFDLPSLEPGTKPYVQLASLQELQVS